MRSQTVRRLSKYSAVLIQEDYGRHYDVRIYEAAFQKLADLGEIPERLVENLPRFVRNVLLMVGMENEDAKRRLSRPQLKAKLKRTARNPDCQELDNRDWFCLLDDLESARLEYPILGPRPFQFTQERFEVWQKLIQKAHQRILRCKEDSNELRQLARDLLEFLDIKLETSQEWFLATQRAAKPNVPYVADCVLKFWIEQLGRPPKITDQLIAFADSMYRLAGMQLTYANIKSQLNFAKKRRGAKAA